MSKESASKGVSTGQAVMSALVEHCQITRQSYHALYNLLFCSDDVEFSVVRFENDSGTKEITVNSLGQGTAVISDAKPRFIK